MVTIGVVHGGFVFIEVDAHEIFVVDEARDGDGGVGASIVRDQAKGCKA